MHVLKLPGKKLQDSQNNQEQLDGTPHKVRLLLHYISLRYPPPLLLFRKTNLIRAWSAVLLGKKTNKKNKNMGSANFARVPFIIHYRETSGFLGITPHTCAVLCYRKSRFETGDLRRLFLTIGEIGMHRQVRERKKKLLEACSLAILRVLSRVSRVSVQAKRRPTID